MRSLALIGLLAPFTCNLPRSPTGTEPGTLSVTWKGSHTGRFAAAASATWCPADTSLEVLATRGDTGVGIALVPADSLRAAQHPTASPATNATWRPLSLAAVRWYTEAQILAFESTSGVVQVTTVGAGTLSGTIDVRLRIPAGRDTLHLVGSFDRLPIHPAKGACGRLSRPTG
jgi:hypothetical protein